MSGRLEVDGERGASVTDRLPTGVAEWFRAAIGREWTIRRVTPLPASSATVLAVEIEADGSRRTLVLRLHDQAWSHEEPDVLAREAAALTLLADTAIPAPRLVAWSERGPSALLMTGVDGVPVLAIPDPGAVTDLLARIHDLPADGLSTWAYGGYHEGVDLARPAWWRDPRTWERAVRQTERARPGADPVVIHRDFHPGNILWVDGRLSGVVDWVNACVGPAAFDASHMRVNLAVLHEPEAANRLFPGDPAWDIEAALGFLDWSSAAAIAEWAGPWPHLPADVARARFEAFVSEALARLG
jgi:aminoglycoside phosphotransferase (APT) family kinase protein